MKKFEGVFETSDTAELFYQCWKQENPKGSLVIAHGFAEHSESYERLAQGISPLGLDIYAFDFRGHGRSPGPRGYVDNFDLYVSDLTTFVEYLEAESVTAPKFLLGHSMGGLVVLRYLLDADHHPFRKVILSSPFLGLKMAVSPLKEKAAHLLHRWLPQVTLPHGIRLEDLSRDEQVVQEYKKDYLRHDKIAPSTFIGMKECMDYVMSHASSIIDPLFFQVAGDDKVVDLEKTKEFFQQLPSIQKKMIVYKNSYHEVYNDLNRHEVYADLINFLKGELL
jgi:alpha-beta hydrolase superfamily lysophospholipase